jgi:hypothetical protein
MTPAWILDIFAALMLVVAAVSAARLAEARPWRRGAVVTDTDVSHLFMGIAMAGMLASSLTTLPNGVWEVIFALLTVWFAGKVARDARANGVRALAGGHCAPHLVHSAAMLYAFLALTAPAASGGSGTGGMAGMSGAGTLRYPTLALAFALILVGYSVWDLDQLSGRRYSMPAAARTAAGVPAMAGAAAASLPASEGGASGSKASGVGLFDGGLSGDKQPTRGFLLSDATTVGCRIVMGVTMAFMLFIMI